MKLFTILFNKQSAAFSHWTMMSFTSISVDITGNKINTLDINLEAINQACKQAKEETSLDETPKIPQKHFLKESAI